MNKKSLDKIKDIQKAIVADGYAAGSLVLIMQDGEEQYFGAEGYMDIEGNRKIERDNIFRLYSMTKPITGFATMLLVEDGLLDVEAPVEDYIPSFKNQKYIDLENRWVLHEAKRPMKIRDLLNMTGGYTYGGDFNKAEIETQKIADDAISRIGSNHEMTTAEFAEKMGTVPLLFSPGEGYNYSYCADILGAVIEVVSGMRFSDFLKKRIFEPLGMNDTDFWVPADKQNRLVKVYGPGAKGLEEYHYNNLIINLEGDHAPAFESGGAGLFSTIDDYAKFARMMLFGGCLNGKKIADAGTIRFMTTATMEEMPRAMKYQNDGNDGTDYCNLLSIMREPARNNTIASRGEYGWDGWLGPYFRNAPECGVTILMMQQKVDAGTTTYTRRIRNVVYSSL